jgi:hypothetical protein
MAVDDMLGPAMARGDVRVVEALGYSMGPVTLLAAHVGHELGWHGRELFCVGCGRRIVEVDW